MVRRIAGVYVVTDRFINPSRSHVDIAKAAVAGGACAVQLRDKEATTRQLLEWARAIRDITLRTDTLFIVNDRVDIALAADADGVHLGDDDMPVPVARRLLGAGKIIGRSVANEDEALKAVTEGADYVSIGSVFATSTKPDAGEPVGVEMVRRVRQVLPPDYPLVAIGGITLQNAAAVFEAGADAVAVVSAVVCADDPVEAVKQLKQLWLKVRGEKR
ncbi:thiamine phosphate synthase [Fervidibacter sacchari]|uniref:Thiamine-phosphate synthase n=1 Tax=Candidatus Fervidibacter sacchari TaxID=1448929 RepID=A0ABT2EMR0_9BACT|nr:thiamine phosphate synthase [Candidatus Fervidibacter sacchari]MCS3919212.1 thiamine-phosphate diphosphorylase [Candidatus Fervidibacter sacchari]WKU17056.1 thiamine phosphate synthase [Candidatus Fervidibacter sacchari]